MTAVRAECQTNSTVVGPRGTPYEEKATDVGAGHGKQHQHCSKQGPQCGPRIAEQLALQRDDRDVLASTRRVVALRQLVERDGENSARAAAGVMPSFIRPMISSQPTDRLSTYIGNAVCDRDPHLRLRRIREATGRNAGDDEQAAVERERCRQSTDLHRIDRATTHG